MGWIKTKLGIQILGMLATMKLRSPRSPPGTRYLVFSFITPLMQVHRFPIRQQGQVVVSHPYLVELPYTILCWTDNT
jgi:hypothetical protein